ncbi:hypothetical protein [Streptomyces tateyamensis]|nr:hypothetical protein [Streptomyces tateyamensis]
MWRVAHAWRLSVARALRLYLDRAHLVEPVTTIVTWVLRHL